MATILPSPTIDGDDTNNVITGTTAADVIYGRGGNDRINGGAGDDTIVGGLGADTLTGDAGNDQLYGGDGNDGFFGGGGNDYISGEVGDDTVFGDAGDDYIEGGEGLDKLTGGTGNDTLVGGPGYTIYDGGAGVDTVVIEFATSTLSNAVRADLASLKAFMDGQLSAAGSVTALATQTAGPKIVLPSLGLSLSNTEAIKILVGGVETPITKLLNDAPTADASVALETVEDAPIKSAVLAQDANGDVLTYTVASGPANGAVTLDAATGQYTYTPTANFSGTDSFRVVVADPGGASVEQTVHVGIAAVADTPNLTVVNPVVVTAGAVIAGLATNTNLQGTAGSDTITGSGANDTIDATGSATITIDVDINASLQDLDGSEQLSITVTNVPSGGVFSAGSANPDGSWSLTAADLAGLKLTANVTSGFTLHVAATATESDGGTATAAADIDVQLSPDSNLLFGGSGNDTIRGGAGNDTIYGNSGNDTIFGNGGNDTIYGGKGDDILSGGVGDNVLRGDSGNDLFIADEGNDTIVGGTDFDTIDYSSVSAAINADLSKKTIVGAMSGTDTISGIEKIIGSAFADTFKGASGNDIIDGGAGHDTLRGIAGSDQLTGGSGSDTFFWEKSDVVGLTGQSLGVDHITDFATGDVLDFHKLVTLGTKALASVVKVTDMAEGSLVSAKINGAFVDVAVLDGVHGKTAADLFHDGQLLVG